jgi:pSer/pThr/pTyr-binding forkhead associated (FHA) protein
MAKLTLILKNKSLGEFRLKKGASLTIGRRETNDVVLEDPAVSGYHAKIDSLGDRFMLTDLQSRNGSFVNEQLVTSHWLAHGDVINIGEHSLSFEINAKEQIRQEDRDEFDETMVINTEQQRRMRMKSNPNKSINIAGFWGKHHHRGVVKKIMPEVPKPYSPDKKAERVAALIYLAGGSGQVELKRKITTIGKDPTSDIVVKGLLVDPTAVTIRKEPDGFYFNFIGGLVKPKINDNPVQDVTLLKNLDVIEIGSTRLQFSCEPQKIDKNY